MLWVVTGALAWLFLIFGDCQLHFVASALSVNCKLSMFVFGVLVVGDARQGSCSELQLFALLWQDGSVGVFS